MALRRDQVDAWAGPGSGPAAGGVGPLLLEAGDDGGGELDGGEACGEGLAALEGKVGFLDLGEDGGGLSED